MSLLGFLLLLLIAGVCGAIAEALVGFSPGGFLVSIAVGLLGAYLGMWLAPRLGLPTLLVLDIEGKSIDVIWTVIGAVLLVLLLSAIRGGRGYRRRRHYR